MTVARSKDKVDELFAWVPQLIHPFWGALWIGCVTSVAMLFATNSLGVALAGVSTYLVIWAIRLEREWMEITPLPPLVALSIGAWIRCGAGGFFLSLGKDPGRYNNQEIWRFIVQGQTLWLALMGFLLLAFTIKKPGVVKTSNTTLTQQQTKYIGALVTVLGLFTISWIVMANWSGTLDKGSENYWYWVAQRWRPDSIFAMFGRLRDAFFILLPIACVKLKNKIAVTLLIATAGVYIAIALPMGGRGLIMYPAVYLVIGTIAGCSDLRLARRLIVTVVVLGITFIPAMQIYRSSGSITNAGTNTLQERLIRTTLGLKDSLINTELGSTYTALGTSLYSCSEGYLFNAQNETKERVGMFDTQKLVLAWIPQLVWKRDGRPVRDGHIISAEVRGMARKEAETVNHKTTTCISFGGDLYWRGGWPWVIGGSAVFAAVYRLIAVLWYRYAGWSSWSSAILALLPATYIQMYPVGTLGETAWLWLWDLPKYILVLCLVYIVMSQSRRRAK